MSDTNSETEVSKPILPLNEKLYKRLKLTCQIILPALATLYFTIGSIWGFPGTEEVIGTVAAVTAFLGVLLGISTKAYNASDARFDGNIIISTNQQGNKLYSLELNGSPNTLDAKSQVTFKIGSNVS